MKVSVNLATLSSPRERYALAWALPLALSGAIGLVMLVYATYRNYTDYQKIQKQAAGLVQQKQQLIEKENELKKELDDPQKTTVFRKVQYVNGLIDKKQFSLTRVTESVAKLLPPTVRLVSMGLTRSREGAMEVRFVVEGKSEEALEAFLSNLEEDTAEFKDFEVSSQGFQHYDTRGNGVAISCTARYVGGQAD